MKTLHIAIDYIHYLRGLIEEYDTRVQEQQQLQQQQQQPHPQHMNGGNDFIGGSWRVTLFIPFNILITNFGKVAVTYVEYWID